LTGCDGSLTRCGGSMVGCGGSLTGLVGSLTRVWWLIGREWWLIGRAWRPPNRARVLIRRAGWPRCRVWCPELGQLAPSQLAPWKTRPCHFAKWMFLSMGNSPHEHLVPRTFFAQRSFPETFCPMDISPREHFTPTEISPRRTFHPRGNSPHGQFAP
jgi:hypothetical protein